MNKYNKSEIMKKAWELFRTFQRDVSPLSFGECLSRAWHFAKANVARNDRLNRVIENGESVNGCYVRKENAADMGRIGYIITGKTYNFRKELKRFGFRFDGETKCWFTFDRNDAIRFVSAIA